jgi:hypothetical protein
VERIPFGKLETERANMLRRLMSQSWPDPAVRERAVTQMEDRLSRWWGGALPPQSRLTFGRSENRTVPKTVAADPAELLIVRAISTTVGTAMFGVSDDGAVFTSDTQTGWSPKGFRVYVSELSPLLDDAAAVFHQIQGGKGGLFFERDGRFFAADETPFLEVQSSGVRVLWQQFTSWVQTLWRSDANPPEPTSPQSPEPVSRLVVNFDTGEWPESGVLSQMGYHAGKTYGLPATARRRILRDVLDVELVPIASGAEAYVQQWGAPGSRQRLHKMARCLAGFARNAERRNADFSEAIADWKSDLDWLRDTHGLWS